MPWPRRFGVVRSAALTVALAACAPSCRRATPVVEPTPLFGELSGCDARDRDGLCEVVAGAELRVIVDARGSLRARFADGPELAPRPTSGDGWTRLELRVPDPVPASLVVRDERGAELRVPLRRSSRPAWLHRANALRKSGDVEGAAEIARAHRDDEGLDGVRGRALWARIQLTRGETEDAAKLLADTTRDFEAEGRNAEAMEDRFARAYLLAKILYRVPEARAALGVGPVPAAGPDARARHSYYAGLVESEAGDIRSALALFARAQRDHERLGSLVEAMDAEEAAAHALLVTGRAREARDHLVALRARDSAAPPCRRADRAVNLGRAMRAASPGPVGIAESTPLFEESLAIIRTSCRSGLREPNLLTELAENAVLAGDPVKARGYLDAVPAAQPEPTTRIVIASERLWGRVALLEREPAKALSRFDRALSLATAAGAFEAQWSSHAGRARALEALRRDDEAIAAYREAERLLDTVILSIPASDGGASLVTELGGSARGLVALSIRRGALRDALSAARAFHARPLRALTHGTELAGLDPATRAKWESAIAEYRRARAELEAAAAKDWALSSADLAVARESRKTQESELRRALDAALAIAAHGRANTPVEDRPRPGEGLFVTWHRGDEKTWVFAATQAEVVAREVTGADWLAPIAGELAAASRVVLAPPSWLVHVDLHVAPIGGAPLATRAAVTYAIDLAGAQVAASTPLRALVVSDPDGNLPSARAEGDDVAKTIAERFAIAPARLHQSAARSEAVAKALPSIDLLHFAGHAHHDASAWASALSLSGGGRVTVADVLALSRGPAVVVLSACDAARSSGDGGELSLAEAFVVAGARAVVAPTRPVEDALAADLSRALHRALDARLDVAAAFRVAMAELAGKHPVGTLGAFRVIVP